MTISVDSGILFLTDSKCLARNGASAVASSGTDSDNYILNWNKAFAWQSVGSDDSTTETITITTNGTQNINSLFLINHNFKDFKVTYNGGNQFTNVKTTNIYDTGFLSDEDGSIFADEGEVGFSDGIIDPFSITTQAIDIVGYSKNTAYFEFDAVDVTTIEVQIFNTQVGDQEKTLNIFSVQSLIGNFSNSGIDKNTPAIDYNTRSYSNILNKPFVTKGLEVFKCSVRLPYVSEQADIDLLESLIDSDDNFILWLCGGKSGTDYFRVNAKPYRLEDVYRVQNTRNSNPAFTQNIYVTGYTNALNLVEVA